MSRCARAALTALVLSKEVDSGHKTVVMTPFIQLRILRWAFRTREDLRDDTAGLQCGHGAPTLGACVSVL